MAIFAIPGFSQNVGINATGVAPNASAGLDVDFSNKGVLIPRVALSSTASFAPLSAHVAGMLVYNTATVNDVTPGFYYNNGSKWVPGFTPGTAPGSILYWNGTDWVSVPAGLPGQFLQLNGSSLPFWGGAANATISTNAATAITSTGATSGGNISSDGGLSVLSRGICYSTSPSPTTANSIVVASPATGIGTFSCNLTGLLSGTTYYVRAYATNSSVTTYGPEISFMTLANIPTLAATTAASFITSTTANSGGNVTADGGAAILERGVCYGTTSNPTTVNTKVIDSAPGIGSFVSNLTGLLGGTTYYVRAYATNSIGTAYGTQISFVTAVSPPTLVTTAVTSISGASAVSGGSMNWNGAGYSNYQNYGVCYSTVPNSATPTYISTNTSNFSVNPLVNITPWVTNLTGLAANTTYYIRSFLYVYRAGWSYVYGNEISFTTTAATAPIIGATTAASLITGSTVRTGGSITSDGGSAITAKGVCWGTSPNPTLGAGNFTTDGTGTLSYISNVTGLSGATTYYIRAYATNSVGTSYGSVDQTFTTCVTPAYNIGDQVGGGIVFYVDCNGGGLIAATTDQGSAVWGCSGTTFNTSGTVGTGSANTAAILAGCATRPIAASLASSYTGGGFSDWYLPSAGELSLMMNQRNILNLGTYVMYYASTDNGSTTVATMYYHTGPFGSVQGTSSMKTGSGTVRAIRSFAPPTLPTVTTDAITNITGTTATTGGNVTSSGGASVTAGVCWSTATSPTIADSHTTDASAVGPFTSTLSGLASGTTYYVRAYVTNVAGTTYGNEVSFTTITVSLATVTTDAITNLLGTSATTGGNVTADGGSAVVNRGVCWDITPNPDITSPTILGISYDAAGGLGAFVSNLTGLTNGQQYYVRAFAINGVGTAYGSDVVFTPTGNAIPTLTTATVTNPTPTGATFGGDITSDGGQPVTARGVCWSNMNYPPTIADSKTIDGAGTGIFTSDITGLTAGNGYWVAAYATNSLGTAYGQVEYYIPVGLPTVASAQLVYNTGDTFAQLIVNVSSDGGDPLTAFGAVWSTSPNPTVASNLGKTSENLANGWYASTLVSPIVNGTTYYVRAYATNGIGTSYGTEIAITPGVLAIPTLTTDPIVNKVGALAEGGATVLSDGGDPIITAGLCWGTTVDPTIVSNSGMTTDGYFGQFFSNLTGLTVGTTYHVRAYATNSTGTAYGADVSFVATAAYIGQVIQGGWMSGNVYYVDGTGTHGLVGLTFSNSPADWGCTSSVTGATGTALFTGLANTNLINADITTNGCTSADLYLQFAAQIVQIQLGTYLPSKDEMDLLWTNAGAASLGAYITPGLYWSSTEIDSTHAWYLDTTATPVWVSGLKTDQYNAWPICAF